jgi:N-methylhydantoinase B
VFSTAGGGGFYSPLERPEEMVLEDVKEGFVSLEKAMEDYGIVIDQRKMSVNMEETKRLREKLSSTKL